MDSDLRKSAAFRRLGHRARTFWERRPTNADIIYPWGSWVPELFFDFGGRRAEELWDETACPEDLSSRILSEVREFLETAEKYEIPDTMCEHFLADTWDFVKGMTVAGVRRKCDQLLEDLAARPPASPSRQNSSSRPSPRRRRKPTEEDRARGARIRAALEPYRESNYLTWDGLGLELGMQRSAFWAVLSGETRSIPRKMRDRAEKLGIQLPSG